MLNKVGVGNIDEDVENLVKARFICESDENYQKDALQNACREWTSYENEANRG